MELPGRRNIETTLLIKLWDGRPGSENGRVGKVDNETGRRDKRWSWSTFAHVAVVI